MKILNFFKNKILIIVLTLALLGGGYALGANLTPGANIASAAPTLYSQDTVTGIYDTVSPAVFEIQVTEQSMGFFGRSTASAQGTGFLIDTQGNILTNNHVVEGATTIKVVIDNGKTVDATVVGTDTTHDLALIKVDASAVSGITPLQLGDSSTVKIGQMAIAIGNPYGYEDTITVGVISGLNRTISDSSSSLTGMLQTDAALNPGNSGGPLLDASGVVIGINTAIETGSMGESARGIGFAVPSNVVKNVLSDLMAGKQVTRPWLGISGVALTESNAEDLGVDVTQGVYVVSVVSGSPADKAGLKGGSVSNGQISGGDVITAVDGKTVASVEDLSNYLDTKQVGDTVTLSVLRNGQNTSVQVTLAARPSNITSNNMPQIPIPTQTPSIPRGWNWNFRP